MGIRHRLNDLDEQLQSGMQIEAMVTAVDIDRLSVDVLHRDVWPAMLIDAGVVEAGDAGVLEQGADLALARQEQIIAKQ